jgi:DNA-binding MarR family transcriptional regulator
MGRGARDSGVSAWLTMRKPTVSYLIGRADRIISAELEDALVDTGLSLPEFTALSVLAARPGLSNARLARRSLVTPQAMHKVVRALESAGLVRRTPLPEGGRALATTITEAGEALVAQVLPRIRAVENQMLHALTASERRELVRLLERATSPGDVRGSRP